MYHYHMRPFRRKIYKNAKWHIFASLLFYIWRVKKKITAVILGKIHAWWDSFLSVCEKKKSLC